MPTTTPIILVRRNVSSTGTESSAANVAATYGGVVVKASPNQAAATAFLTWLASPGGQAILAVFGFQTAPG